MPCYTSLICRLYLGFICHRTVTALLVWAAPHGHRDVGTLSQSSQHNLHHDGLRIIPAHLLLPTDRRRVGLTLGGIGGSLGHPCGPCGP